MLKYFFLLTFLLLLLFPKLVIAETDVFQPVTTSYSDTYLLNDSRDIQVEREIKLTNQTDKYYVSEYVLNFSDTADLETMKVYEDGKPTEIQRNGNEVRIKFALISVGKNKQKTLKFIFNLKKYLLQFGEYRELIIPIKETLKDKSLVEFKIKVLAPITYPDIGISKPTIITIEKGIYEWSNLEKENISTVSLAFGKTANYKVVLKYYLENTETVRKRVAIPLVPDGVYQKIFLTKINPMPETVYLDSDDNYLAGFLLLPKQKQEVTFEAVVSLSNKARSEVLNYQKNHYFGDKLSRYLTAEKYWKLTDIKLPSIKRAQEVYGLVVDKLNYSEERVNESLTRMGAEWAWKNPNSSVCMEFSDLFIGIAREKGIPAREVVGYAVSNENDLPSSFLGDVLHAWPEYFDTLREHWQPVDPTWGKTSGLDYYFNMDLNHISFVYHGKDTTYPLPPGVYKRKKEAKDISVYPVNTLPVDSNKITVTYLNPKNLKMGPESKLLFTIKSKSNVFIYNSRLQLVVMINNHSYKSKSKILDVIVPMEEKQEEFVVDLPLKAKAKEYKILLLINDNVIWEKNLVFPKNNILTIVENEYLVILVSVVFIIFIYIWKKRRT